MGVWGNLLVAMCGVVVMRLQRGMHALQHGQLVMQPLIVPHCLLYRCVEGCNFVLQACRAGLPLHSLQLQLSK